jgi:membrane protein YdbS with pleckstrin-like domain
MGVAKMQSLDAIHDTAKRIKLLNALAGVLAYPAALGFAWLWLIEGQHRGLLGFAFIWLLVAGVYVRVYAQFLRWWHQVDYSRVSMKAQRSSSGSFMRSRRQPRNVQDESFAGLEGRLLAVAGR